MNTLKAIVHDKEAATVLTRLPTLGPAAINAVKQWRYKVYLLNGQPVGVETTVKFELRA